MTESVAPEKEPKVSIAFGDVVDRYAVSDDGEGSEVIELKDRRVVVGFEMKDGEQLVSASKLGEKDGQPTLATSGTITPKERLALVTSEPAWTLEQAAEASRRFYGIPDRPETVEQFRASLQESAEAGPLPYDFYEPQS